MKHHAYPAVSPSAPRDVVPCDEGTRVCGTRSTTPTRRSAHPTSKTWCPATKEQGFAGSKAPRPTCRRPTNPRDVVPRDEETRVCGERSTTSAQPEAPPLRRSPARTPGRRPKSPNQWRGHGIESPGAGGPRRPVPPPGVRSAGGTTSPDPVGPTTRAEPPLPTRLQLQSR